MGCLQEIARLSARWTRLLQGRKSTTRAAAEESEQQGSDLLQNLRRCLVYASGGLVPLSAESHMSNKAGYPQKVWGDSSRRRFFYILRRS